MGLGHRQDDRACDRQQGDAGEDRQVDHRMGKAAQSSCSGINKGEATVLSKIPPKDRVTLAYQARHESRFFVLWPLDSCLEMARDIVLKSFRPEFRLNNWLERGEFRNHSELVQDLARCKGQNPGPVSLGPDQCKLTEQVNRNGLRLVDEDHLHSLLSCSLSKLLVFGD